MVNIIGRRVGIQEVGSPAAGNSLGKVFASLGKTLFGDTLTPALKREQMQKIADENEARKFAVDSVDESGNFTSPRAASISAMLSAIDPVKLGRMRALEGYRLEGLDSQTGQRASAGLGEYNATPEHQRRALDNSLVLKDREEATKRALAANLPETVLRPGPDGSMVPTIVPRSESYGQPAVTSLDQQKAIAAGPAISTLDMPQRQQLLTGAPQQRTPRNYVANGQSFVTYDGVTRADGQGPLPPGGTMAEITGSATEAGLRPNVQGALQQATIDRGRFKSMVGFTRNIAMQDPTLFGLPGQIRRLGQEGLQLANGLAQTFGASDINSAKSEAVNKLSASGVNPKLLSELFDPNLPALQSASSLLVYQAASALAGQQGRSVTDKDLVVFRNIAGDPNSMFESQQSYLTRLQTMEDMVDMMAGSDQRISGQPTMGGAQQPQVQQPQAPVPRQMQTPQGTVIIRKRGE